MMFRSICFCLSLVVSTAVQAQEALPLAKLITVEMDDTGTTRTFFGHVVAKETVELAFQVGGQVVAFPIVEGASVPKGGLIAELDREPFQLALDQARTQQEQADRTLARLEQLQGTTVSQVTVDDAKTQSQLAEIAVRDAERSLGLATLSAPFDALVAAKIIPNFSTLGAGTTVARLHDMSELRIEIEVPETLVQSAGADPDLELWAKFPSSDQRFELGIREFNAETSSVGQTFSITLGMAPPEDLVVLPGSSVTVIAVLKGQGARLEIPASALVMDAAGKPHVMLFSPAGANEGQVTERRVEIEPAADGSVQVVSGLQAGDEIVASGATLLNDGDSVRRFAGFAN